MNTDIKNYRLIDARKARGFSQTKMALLLGYRTCSGYALAESGLIPSEEKQKKIADILGVPVADLWPLEED